jgi:hypothetical protein
MTRPVTSSTSPNMSAYDPADQVSRADGTGGATSVSNTAGAEGAGNVPEGAGNVPKTATRPPSLYCLPEATSVARDCGAAMLIANFTAGFFCGMSVGALAECLEPRK